MNSHNAHANRLPAQWQALLDGTWVSALLLAVCFVLLTGLTQPGLNINLGSSLDDTETTETIAEQNLPAPAFLDGSSGEDDNGLPAPELAPVQFSHQIGAYHSPTTPAINAEFSPDTRPPNLS